MASITLELAEAQEFIIAQAARVQEQSLNEFAEDVLMRAACETMAQRSLINAAKQSGRSFNEALGRWLSGWNGSSAHAEALPASAKAELLERADEHIAAVRKLLQEQQKQRELQRQIMAIETQNQR